MAKKINKSYISKKNETLTIELNEVRSSAILVDEKLIVINDNNDMQCIYSENNGVIENTFYPIEHPTKEFYSISKSIKNKAKLIIDKIYNFDSQLRITDFQLTKILTKTSVLFPCKRSKSKNLEEYIFEIEVQKKVNGNTILGSSYIYKPKIEDIKIKDIMKTLTFPFINTDYQKINFDENYDLIVFDKPMFSSIMENLIYHEFIDHPIVENNSNVIIYDDPTHDRSFNYIPFDDKGDDTIAHHLYGYDNGYDCSPIQYRFLIPDKKCHRDIRSCLNVHPTNVVIESKKMVNTHVKFRKIKTGLYCYLMVGNHFCKGEFIEGTVFNAFTIKNGRLDVSLAPFKIKINKNELLRNIVCIGNDYDFVRPFPWWTPIVTKIPTVFVKNILLN